MVVTVSRRHGEHILNAPSLLITDGRLSLSYFSWPLGIAGLPFHANYQIIQQVRSSHERQICGIVHSVITSSWVGRYGII